jgi:hypothetical protein
MKRGITVRVILVTAREAREDRLAITVRRVDVAAGMALRPLTAARSLTLPG